MPSRAKKIRIGIGGWVFEPWRESFYPPGTRSAEFLPYASRQLTSVEVNATFYRTQSPTTFRAWHDATPDEFVFTLKGPRGATATRDSGHAAVAVERFLSSGLTELGAKLGPIAWQFPANRRFDRAELAAFVALLPHDRNGIRLRHAIEAGHESFKSPDCAALLRAGSISRVVLAESGPAEADEFVYARLKGTVAHEPAGFSSADLDAWAARIRRWSRQRECFVFVISGAKSRNPQAARELIRRLG